MYACQPLHKYLTHFSFSWEYPNKQGIGCNVVDSDDTANFLSFLQELREDCSNLTISAAVSVTPFIDSSGEPSTNVTAFAKVLDYIAIMDYDIWGSWSSAVGPNAPLYDSCASSSYQQGSAASAVNAWSNAGMPVGQIVLGVASYGHSYSVKPSDAFVSGTKTLAAYPAFNSSNQPVGDAWDNTGGADSCGVYQGSGGTFNFWGLVDGGFLDSEGTTADGIYYRFDSCSQTVRTPLNKGLHLFLTDLLAALRLQRNLRGHDFLRQRTVVQSQGHIHRKHWAAGVCYVAGGWGLQQYPRRCHQ